MRHQNTSQFNATQALAKWMRLHPAIAAPAQDPECYHLARAAFNVLDDAGFRVARKPQPRYPKASY